MRFLTPELRSVIAKKITARLDLFFFNLPGNTSTLLSSEEIKILRAVFFSLSAMMYLKMFYKPSKNATLFYETQMISLP